MPSDPPNAARDGGGPRSASVAVTAFTASASPSATGSGGGRYPVALKEYF